jgi:three-Cys-motif partner protein
VAAPKTTIWELAPHTRAKHEILRRYLQAWTPILSHGGFPEFIYIDGFAGPGRYSQGEDGSPVIALKAALGQTLPSSTRIFFLFIECDPERGKVLKEVAEGIERPSNFRVKVADGETFESEAKRLLDFYRSKRKPLPPTFCFVDPFGWKGAPFLLVSEIMKHPSCEVLVNFMYEEINRFLGHPDQPDNFDTFFGTPRWRDCLQATASHRNRCLRELYTAQLHAAGAAYVRSFEMRNDAGVTDYYLFYATKSIRGLQKMKEAMWKVDSTGEFKFSDATDPSQLVMFSEPSFEILARQIRSRFVGTEVTVKEVEDFVLTETAFRETHYKKLLAEFEKSDPPVITVVDSKHGRRRGTYGDPSMRLRFT